MKATLTVKLSPSEPGEVFEPMAVHAIIQGYINLREKEYFGNPDLVSLRFLIEGRGGECYPVEVPDVQEEPSVPVQGVPVID